MNIKGRSTVKQSTALLIITSALLIVNVVTKPLGTAQLETEQTENINIISDNESLTDPSSNQNINIISDNESLVDPSNQNQDIITSEETGEETGEDIINQEETLGDNERTGEDTRTTNQPGEDIINQEETGEDNINNGTTDETTSNTESLTDPSSNENQDTSTYTPDEIIEMTKQTSDQVDTPSDQTISTSSPIIYIPKTLILGQDGSCNYIVQADTSTLQTNQEIQVIPSETFEMTNIHNENLKYIGTTSQDKNIITSSEPLIQGNLRCDIKRPGNYKGTVQFDISIKTSDITK